MSARTGTDWIESLDPWPEEFGLDRMRALLAELGDPQRSLPAIHVVGTNGKSTTARMIEALLLANGVSAGAYTSPHVVSWRERIRVGGEDADFEQAIGRVREPAERLGATQFEALTAGALAEFSARGVAAAVVEAGLGGRLDATNVLDTATVVLTNVGLDHTEHLGRTREAIAEEKLAVVRRGSSVVLGEPEWAALADRLGAGSVTVETRGALALARAAAESFLGRAVDPTPAVGVALPGRCEVVARAPLEIWDGAHNAEGARYLLARLDPLPAPVVLVASILRDKPAAEMLALLGTVAPTLVATESASARRIPAPELAELASRLGLFERVELDPDPARARLRARELAGAAGSVLVAGSLYLLADLAAVRPADVR